MDGPADHVEVKSAVTPLSIAIDAVAVFTGLVGWVFILWVPLLLAVILAIAIKKHGFSLGVLFLLIFVAAVLVPFGMFLNWVSRGIVQRARTRIGLLAFVLTIWGTLLLVVARLKGYQGLHALETYLQGAVMLSIAIVCLLVVAKREES